MGHPRISMSQSRGSCSISLPCFLTHALALLCRNESSLVSALKTLLFFTIMMVTLPIGLYFATKAYLFEGKLCNPTYLICVYFCFIYQIYRPANSGQAPLVVQGKEMFCSILFSSCNSIYSGLLHNILFDWCKTFFLTQIILLICRLCTVRSITVVMDQFI